MWGEGRVSGKNEELVERERVSREKGELVERKES